MSIMVMKCYLCFTVYTQWAMVLLMVLLTFLIISGGWGNSLCTAGRSHSDVMVWYVFQVNRDRQEYKAVLRFAAFKLQNMTLGFQAAKSSCAKIWVVDTLHSFILMIINRQKSKKCLNMSAHTAHILNFTDKIFIEKDTSCTLAKII